MRSRPYTLSVPLRSDRAHQTTPHAHVHHTCVMWTRGEAHSTTGGSSTSSRRPRCRCCSSLVFSHSWSCLEWSVSVRLHPRRKGLETRATSGMEPEGAGCRHPATGIRTVRWAARDDAYASRATTRPMYTEAEHARPRLSAPPSRASWTRRRRRRRRRRRAGRRRPF